jgi:DnaJ-class molecular chaperone
MGIFDRLGDVISSYINNDDKQIFGRGRSEFRSTDPDVNEAYDELNDFLNKDRARSGRWADENPDENTGGSQTKSGKSSNNRVPEELKSCFDELGVPFGASIEDCKQAYKSLLKIHHPDKHAKHPGNFQKATQKTAKINAAYDKIEKWRETGIV